MKEVFCSGGLGDSYIFLLKMIKDGSFFRVYHRVEQEYYKDAIREIYNLSTSNRVEFVDYDRKDLLEVTSDSHEGEMEFFPTFSIYNNFRLEEPYLVIQAHSGKDRERNCKKLPPYFINEIIESSGLTCVLLGTDSAYIGIQNCINLVGSTDIRDCLSIITYCEDFIGPEGLLSFVALSQRKESTIFYSQYEAVGKRIVGTPWEKYANLVDMRNI